MLDKTYLKGYFRLANSLKARKLYIEAAGVASLGLDIDPNNGPLRKIKIACTKERNAQSGNAKKIFGDLYSDKSFAKADAKSKKASGSSTKTTKSIGSASDLNDIERKMLQNIKTLAHRLQNGEFSSNEADLHMLQGTFRKLADKETFADLVFPGVPSEVLKTLPQSLCDLMQWKSMTMMVDEALPKIARSAGKIFEGTQYFKNIA